MFLIDDDYLSQIRDYDLDQIIDNLLTIRQDAETKAQAEMESYLRERFDVAQIFSQTGIDRNPLIIMYMVDIALYHLFSGISPRDIPEIRRIRYERAIKWLDELRKGNLSAPLPLVQDTNGNTNGTSIFGSYPQNGYNW